MSLIAALGLLTLLRVPRAGGAAGDGVQRSIRWFPLVGSLIGLTVGIVDLLCGPLASPQIRAVVDIGLLAAVTGGLHLDGLMDSCDGLFVFATRDRRLAIMHDSHVGSYAIVGVVLALLLKFSAIVVLPEHLRLGGFIAMGALSRWSMVLVLVLFPSARPDGLGHAFKESAQPRDLLIASLFALLAVVPLGVIGLLVFCLSGILSLVAGQAVVKRIGGLTGDTYGAISELVEIGVLIAIQPLSRFLAM